MCEICRIDKMGGNVTFDQLWSEIAKLGRYIEIEKCQELSTYDRGYWQGVFHTLGDVELFPEMFKRSFIEVKAEQKAKVLGVGSIPIVNSSNTGES